MYTRILKKQIYEKFFSGKAIIIAGARQTGKTTLSMDLLQKSGEGHYKVFNCDNPSDREMLTDKNLEFLKQLVGDSKVVLIDEGQKVTTIGQTVKLLVDFYKKEKQVVVTGSSSLNLLDQTHEPLTGRKYVYTLYPLSLEEIYPDRDVLTMTKELEGLLVFGSYPEVVTQKSFEAKAELLRELQSSYLYKDVLEFQAVRNSDKIMKLVRALALQVGSEVSCTELSSLIGIDKKTVEHYIDVLEKSFVVFTLAPYAKNKRREISKLKKVYFHDLGIRNAVINNFNFLENRGDTGILWENFLMTERLKYRQHHHLHANSYFWRTYDGSEVDLVEELEGKLNGYEFKWKEKRRKTGGPAKWLEYPGSSFQIVTTQNLQNFLF